MRTKPTIACKMCEFIIYIKNLPHVLATKCDFYETEQGWIKLTCDCVKYPNLYWNFGYVATVSIVLSTLEWFISNN